MSPQLVAKVMLAAEPSVGAASNATSLARGVPGAVQSRIGGSSIAGSLTSADALGAAEADASAGADASADGSADADAEGVATAEAAVVASTAVVSPEPQRAADEHPRERAGDEDAHHDDGDDALVAAALVGVRGPPGLLALVLGAREVALALAAGHGGPFDVTAP